MPNALSYHRTRVAEARLMAGLASLMTALLTTGDVAIFGWNRLAWCGAVVTAALLAMAGYAHWALRHISNPGRYTARRAARAARRAGTPDAAFDVDGGHRDA